jgi:ferric-dicitrate binding protein FerR (iron transport regulator)
MDRSERDDDLLMGALDGQLSEDDLRVLAGRLKEEPQLARRMMEVARDESLLAEVLAKPGAQAWSPGAARPRPERARPARVRWGMWISVAACLAIIVGALVYNARQEERFVEVMVARIRKTSPDVKVVRAADGKAVVAVVGMDLVAGDRIETKKGRKVVFGYPNEKTTITAGSGDQDTAVRIGDTSKGKRLHLENGILDASVDPQPADRRMVITTPHARAEVKGTRFTLHVTRDETLLVVTEGLVTLLSLRNDETTDVGTGTRVTVRRDAITVAGQTRGEEAGEGRAPILPAYVDGAILFAEDFEDGFGAWKPVEESADGVTFRGLRDGDPGVRLAGRNGESRASQCAEISHGRKKARGIRATLPVNVDAYVVEYSFKLRTASREGFRFDRSWGPVENLLPEESRRFVKDNVWGRKRVEVVRLEAEKELSMVDVKTYQGGALYSHARYRSSARRPVICVLRGSVLVDDVLVRRLEVSDKGGAR